MIRRALYPAVLLLFVGLQFAFWLQTKDIRPRLDIVPPVPGKIAVQALSLGDSQFYFRVLGLELQNMGDTFGRFTALYKYDFEKLYRWMELLDLLDRQSNYIPTLASYYFSQTQYKPDVRYMVDYLDQHAGDRPQEKWWWLVQAVYLANHKLEDKDRAMSIANKLVGVRDIPIWAQQMPAFIHEQRGEFEDARSIMESIQQDAKDLPPGELEFMRIFVEERLDALEKKYDKGKTR